LLDGDEFTFDRASPIRSYSFSASSQLMIRTRPFFDSERASLSVIHYLSTTIYVLSPNCSKFRER
jgi:hypothetical protein